MWVSIQKILPSKKRSLGLEASFAIYTLQARWDQIIGAILGPAFQKKAKPMKIKDKVLLVDCLNSIWANEMQMKEKIIMERLKRSFPKMGIERIKFIS